MFNGLKFLDASGVMRSVSTANPLPVSGGGGGAPAGDASAANQVITNAALGTPADTTAADATGSKTVVSLLKGVLVAGQAGLTNAQLRASAVSVSGPITNAQFVVAMGTPADAAWDGSAATATVISLLKAIAINTTPAPAP